MSLVLPHLPRAGSQILASLETGVLEDRCTAHGFFYITSVVFSALEKLHEHHSQHQEPITLSTT